MDSRRHPQAASQFLDSDGFGTDGTARPTAPSLSQPGRLPSYQGSRYPLSSRGGLTLLSLAQSEEAASLPERMGLSGLQHRGWRLDLHLHPSTLPARKDRTSNQSSPPTRAASALHLQVSSGTTDSGTVAPVDSQRRGGLRPVRRLVRLRAYAQLHPASGLARHLRRPIQPSLERSTPRSALLGPTAPAVCPRRHICYGWFESHLPYASPHRSPEKGPLRRPWVGNEKALPGSTPGVLHQYGSLPSQTLVCRTLPMSSGYIGTSTPATGPSGLVRKPSPPATSRLSCNASCENRSTSSHASNVCSDQQSSILKPDVCWSTLPGGHQYSLVQVHLSTIFASVQHRGSHGHRCSS